MLLSSCVNNINYDDDLLPAALGGNGFSLGLYKVGEAIEAKRTFTINNPSFEKDIVFGNHTKSEKEFLLLVFDHAKQIDFEINGEVHRSYLFKESENGYARLSINIPNLDKGFHSINYIIVRQPNVNIIDFEKLNEANALSTIYNVRVNLLYGITKIPEQIEYNTQDIISRDGTLHGVLINQSDEYNVWLSGIIREKEDLKYNLYYGNSSNNPIDYYVVSLFNWNQVPINESKDFLYSRLTIKDQMKVEAKLYNQQKLQDENILVVFLLPNPYVDLPDSNPYTVDPLASFRTILNKSTN